MTAPTSLPSALRAAASGLCALEAATGLISAQESWLGRDDFARFILRGPGTAAIDWEGAITALDAGELPCSGGERRILRLGASLARDIPVGLGDAVTGIDQRNVALLLAAIRRASGHG
jgi:hypothetical protein